MKERYFTVADQAELFHETSGGIYVTGYVDDRAERIGTTIDGWSVWYLHTSGGVERLGIETRELPEVKAVVLGLESQPMGRLGLAVTFAEYLSDHRTRRSNIHAPCIIAPSKLSPPEGYVRLPHLIGYAHSDGVRDMVMWELLSRSEAEQWLGDKLPDQAFVEAHLPSLLRIRQHVREQAVTNDPLYHELTAVLTKEARYISILFVYQHLGLFKAIFESLSDQQTQGSTGQQDE